MIAEPSPLTNQLKRWVRSLRKKQNQEKENLFFVTGIKNVNTLLNSHYLVHTLLICPKLYNKWSREKKLSASIYLTPPNLLSSLSPITTNEQVLAIAYRKKINSSVEPSALSKRLLLVDQVNQPQNLGALLRVAAWYHIPHLIYAPGGVSHYNPKVIQASMGAFFHLDMSCQPLLPLLQRLKKRNIPIIGALLDGPSLSTTTLPSSASALLVGSESHGITPELLPYITQKITIEKRNSLANSLNVAVAAGIICEKWCQTQ